jgi:hypothetical protein
VEDLVASTNKVLYVLKDQLDTASVALNDTGAIDSETRYYLCWLPVLATPFIRANLRRELARDTPRVP